MRTLRPLVIFGAIVILVSSSAFIFKLTEFSRTLLKGEIHGFAAVAIGTYLVGMVALLCFTLWGVVRGHFRDLEAPKHRMLALDREIERIEAAAGRPVVVGDLAGDLAGDATPAPEPRHG